MQSAIHRFCIHITILFIAILAGGYGCSDPITPTTLDKKEGYYADGEVRTAVEAQNTQFTPVKLIITGDGFIEDDYKDNGAFDKAANRAIESLFSVEPYKSYKAYFKVLKIAAYSSQQGATTSTYNEANTVFKVKLTGGTGLAGTDLTVFNYVKKATGMTDSDLNACPILVISNYSYYGGTTYSYLSGKSIAYVTLSSGTSQQTRFENVVVHEFGGHGFGRLADEYVTHPQQNISEDATRLTEIQTFQAAGFNQNISLTALRSECPWNFFFNYSTTYPNVSLFEGGALYGFGVWRPEQISCMDDNRLYFNGPSRAAIVKRVMTTSGQVFSMSDFIAKDVDRLTTLPSSSGTKATVSADFVPLAPPVMIED